MSQTLEQAAQRETVMDVTEEQLARVYGQAFLGAASKAKDVTSLVEELESLVDDVLNKFPDLEATLGSALIAHEEKIALLDRIFGGKASETVLNFLKVLSAHGRLDIVRSVARAVHHLYNDQSGKVEVELRVANPMPEDIKEEVIGMLRTTLDAEPELLIREDPSRIAGFVVRGGDTLYDGSVKTRFERARKAIIQRAIQQIETRPEKFFNGDTR